MQVKIWQEQISIPTYRTGAPDKNPMFFENRVYQGSSGVVYPNQIIEKIEDEKVDQLYNGLFLENDYLKIMILPEIGGRVHMAFDKIANRHFIYYNHVIKPALVGLCGPWISGGIEINWPQHHRPSTFEPIDYAIEDNADGSKTVWVNEVEKMFHTKGMAGFTLYPDKAYLEIKAELYNRTNLPQTFLWWVNPAVSVNDDYQSVFPPDVNAVFDHGKRDVSSFPIATGTYYKVDYSPGTDISRYKNIPVPTSYMAVNSEYDFIGGYEHDTRAGVLHVADHHISPGKKQWTWGNGDFGIAWDRNLTDSDGPYIELMVGVFTDNQPDFAWIAPYEGKTFKQYFLPYRNVGMVKNATKDLLLGIEKSGEMLTVKIFGTSRQKTLKLELKHHEKLLFADIFDISPEQDYIKNVPVDRSLPEKEVKIVILDPQGNELLQYDPASDKLNDIPEPAKAALTPEDITTTEQLFLTGQHIEQYRHATYNPVTYYEEALKRDPADIRNNNALGLWLLRRGQFVKSEPYFRNAIRSSIQRNPNPYDSEPYYNLGLSLQYQGKIDEAYDAFFKAAWSSAFQDKAYFSVAQIELLNKNYESALEHINWAIDRNACNGKAYLIKIYALRKLKRIEEAILVGNETIRRDKFNLSALFELSCCYQDIKNEKKSKEYINELKRLSRGVSHNLIEYAIEYGTIGLYHQATEILQYNASPQNDPLINYYLSYYWHKAGNEKRSIFYQNRTNLNEKGNCFPNRLEDILILEWVIKSFPADGYALYYLGNLWYDKRQYTEAVACWQKSSLLIDTFPTVYRNLAIANYNKLKDPKSALQYFEKAYQLNPNDARVLMELDQLKKRLNYLPETRLGFLEEHISIATQRDDIYLEIAAIHNWTEDFTTAHDLIMNRQFHPWEGGEGKVSGQYAYSLVESAKIDIYNHKLGEAIAKLEKAQMYPVNLGEGKLYAARENDIFYWLGCAYKGLNDDQSALKYWDMATFGLSESGAAMFYNDQQPDKIFYKGLAWAKLGEDGLSKSIFEQLVEYGKEHIQDEVRLDYFAVSLPDLLIFEGDLNKQNFIHCQYISGLGYLGLKQYEKAEILFKAVLTDDSMHFGAKTHFNLLLAMKQMINQ